MATVKARFRPSTLPGREGTLYYRVTHRRVSRQVSTCHRLRPDEWEDGHVKLLPPGDDTERARHLRTVAGRLVQDLARFGEIIRRMDLSGTDYTARQVVDAFRTTAAGDASGLRTFVRHLAPRLRKDGQERLAETYATSVRSFLRFHAPAPDLPFTAIDADLMGRYETWLKRRGLALNTVSFYLRNLRAIYHRAVEAGLTEDRRPFRRVFTGVEKTAKRAVPVPVIRRIRNLSLPPGSPLEQARDLFLLSFYTRGMPFVDLAGLRKQDLRDGILAYRRRKTGQALTVRWEQPMQDIVERHPCPDSPYLLPVLDAAGKDGRRRYLNALHMLNRQLKAIGRMVDSPIPLTSYCARHAWASIARSEHVPVGTISEAMGHTSERTTRIYLASLDTSAVDEANCKVIRAVCGKEDG